MDATDELGERERGQPSFIASQPALPSLAAKEEIYLFHIGEGEVHSARREADGLAGRARLAQEGAVAEGVDGREREEGRRGAERNKRDIKYGGRRLSSASACAGLGRVWVAVVVEVPERVEGGREGERKGAWYRTTLSRQGRGSGRGVVVVVVAVVVV